MKFVLPSYLMKTFGMPFVISAISLVALVAFVTFTYSVPTGLATDCRVVTKALSGYETGRHAGHIEAVGCNGSIEVKKFEVTNNIFAGYTKADDVFSHIEVGKIYTFNTLGTSLNYFMVENITGVATN